MPATQTQTQSASSPRMTGKPIQARTSQTPKSVKTPQASPKSAQNQGGLKEKLGALPQTAGIALFAALLVVSLFVGNARALQRVTPRAFLRQGDVASIVENRAAQARNAMTVASRAGISEATMSAVEQAIKAFEGAKTAREISRADQTMTSAVSEMIVSASAQLEGENRTMLSRAADVFSEHGSFLRQEARSYNQKAQKAHDLYERLPTRFVLSEPDVYEGI